MDMKTVSSHLQSVIVDQVAKHEHGQKIDQNQWRLEKACTPDSCAQVNVNSPQARKP